MSDKITGNKVGAPSVKLTGSLGLKNVNEIVETADSAAQAKASAKAAKESEIISSKNAVTAKSQATNAENSANSATASADSSSASAAASSSDAASATASADKAKASETAAKESANIASDSADKSKASETSAKASETAAKASETAAKTSETAAKASADKSKASEGVSKVSADNSSASASASSSDAASATASADKAKASETAAKTSETAAKTSETAAKASETSAKASETAAKASAVEAKTSEAAAKTSETAAKASAVGAKASADKSKVSADNSSASAAASSSDAASATASADKAKASETAAKESANIASDSMNFKTETVLIAATESPRVEFIQDIHTFRFYMPESVFKVLPPGEYDMSLYNLVFFERSTKAWWNGVEYGVNVPRIKEGKLLVEPQATNYQWWGIEDKNKCSLSLIDGWYLITNPAKNTNATRAASGLFARRTAKIDGLATVSFDVDLKRSVGILWVAIEIRALLYAQLRVDLSAPTDVLFSENISGVSLTRDGENLHVSCNMQGLMNSWQSIGLYDAKTTDTLTIKNIQFEQGSVATSYIPTTSTAVTRAADIATVKDK